MFEIFLRRFTAKTRRLGIALAVIGILCALGVLQLQRVEATNQRLPPLAAALPYHEAMVTHLAPADGVGEIPSLSGGIPFRFELEPGETLGSVLGGLGLESREAHRLSLTLADHVEVRRLKAGSAYDVYLSPALGLQAFALAVDDRGKVTAQRDDGGWQVSWRAFERTVRLGVADGALEGALESAVRAAGAPVAVTFRMAEALQWDLDFNRDLRLGDHFQVLYEEVYLDGQYSGVGPALAVQYENRGQRIEAYRFGDDGGLYDEEGRPLRKMFLRSPLPYSRVTSGFSHRRFHPVLKTYRPHYGVDYGAPVGTPVRATGNGMVIFAGWNKGGGKTIKVRHPNDFETGYLHLSRFAPGIASGRRVRQGEVIGYVGATGLATGPHLDYRVKHRGRYVNPLSIKSVPADPIAQKDLPAFIHWRDALRESLRTGDTGPVLVAHTQLAAAPGSPSGEPSPDAAASETEARRTRSTAR